MGELLVSGRVPPVEGKGAFFEANFHRDQPAGWKFPLNCGGLVRESPPKLPQSFRFGNYNFVICLAYIGY